MVTLVRGLTGTIHRSTCKVKGGIHKVIAPEIAIDDVAAFIAARELTDICGSCLRDWKTR